MIERHNYVHIFVHNETGQPLDVNDWKITIPPLSDRNCPKEEYDADHPAPYVMTSASYALPKELEVQKQPALNEIRILFYAGRSQKKYVAMDYMNQGHIDPATRPPALPHGHNDIDWPNAEIGLNGSPMRSASISAKGDHEAPHKLNFYFPMTITTKGGFVLDLLLAQSGPGTGFLKRMYHIARAVEHGVKAGVKYYDGDEEEALEDTQKFAKDLKTICHDNHNLWYVTVRGTADWPAAAVDKHHILKTDRVKNSLLYTGPAGTADPPVKLQSARFYYYSEHAPTTHAYYTFNLVLYDERPLPARLLEEKTGTQMLFIDKNSELHRYHLDDERRLLTTRRVHHDYKYELALLPNVFAEDDVCCFIASSSDNSNHPIYSLVVCSIQGRWAEREFDGVRAKPVIHKGKVYFSAYDGAAGKIGIYCFDSANPTAAATLAVECFSIPARLTIPPGSDYIYYLAAGGSQFKGYHLFRCNLLDTVRVPQLIREPAENVNGRSLDDIQFVVCKDHVYYSEHRGLYRVPADGSAGWTRIAEAYTVAGTREYGICASPDGQYIFVYARDLTNHYSIVRVSTNDLGARQIWQQHSGEIQAVSEHLLFLDDEAASTIDFAGKKFGNNILDAPAERA